jgi:hypothetical protein
MFVEEICLSASYFTTACCQTCAVFFLPGITHPNPAKPVAKCIFTAPRFYAIVGDALAKVKNSKATCYQRGRDSKPTDLLGDVFLNVRM